MAVALLLAGCSAGFDRYFGTDKPPPAEADPKVATEGATPEATDPPGTEQPYPNLGSVPQTRPIRQSQDSQRQEVAKGLVADRQNARYTDEVIRRDPVQGAAMARAGATQPKLPTVPGGPPPPAQVAKSEPPKGEAAKPAEAEGKPAASAAAPAATQPGLPQPTLPTAPPS
ncbi:MAG: hypothetical protein L6R19_14825, partial [Alphaproteobacteria bacterium]|nr:hypothetical protein [Alphaproteobacteria bacterium]